MVGVGARSPSLRRSEEGWRRGVRQVHPRRGQAREDGTRPTEGIPSGATWARPPFFWAESRRSGSLRRQRETVSLGQGRSRRGRQAGPGEGTGDRTPSAGRRDAQESRGRRTVRPHIVVAMQGSAVGPVGLAFTRRGMGEDRGAARVPARPRHLGGRGARAHALARVPTLEARSRRRGTEARSSTVGTSTCGWRLAIGARAAPCRDREAGEKAGQMGSATSTSRTSRG